MVGSKLKDLFSDSKLSDDYLNSDIYRDKSNDYIYRIKIYRSKLSNHINRIEIKKCSKYYINFDNLNYSFEFDKCQYSLDELKQFVEYLNIKKEHLYSDNDGNYVPSVTFGGIIKNEEIDQYYAKDNKSKLYSGSKTGLSGASVFEYIDNAYLGREYNPAKPLVLDLNAKYGIALFKEDNMVTRNIYFTRYKK